MIHDFMTIQVLNLVNCGRLRGHWWRSWFGGDHAFISSVGGDPHSLRYSHRPPCGWSQTDLRSIADRPAGGGWVDSHLHPPHLPWRAVPGSADGRPLRKNWTHIHPQVRPTEPALTCFLRVFYGRSFKHFTFQTKTSIEPCKEEEVRSKGAKRAHPSVGGRSISPAGAKIIRKLIHQGTEPHQDKHGGLKWLRSISPELPATSAQ